MIKCTDDCDPMFVSHLLQGVALAVNPLDRIQYVASCDVVDECLLLFGGPLVPAFQAVLGIDF